MSGKSLTPGRIKPAFTGNNDLREPRGKEGGTLGERIRSSGLSKRLEGRGGSPLERLILE